MTTTLPRLHRQPSADGFGPVTAYRAGRTKRRRRRRLLVVLVIGTPAVLWGATPVLDTLDRFHGSGHQSVTVSAAPDGVLPASGQAAYAVDGITGIRAGVDQPAVPIASLAKVMTAYLVLRHHPLEADQQGPAVRINAAAVADTLTRRVRDESVVAVEDGERLTERQALTALLLPSANNIAVVLAQQDAGSQSSFVAQMNATAHELGMNDTSYTDPSGFDSGTVSTAADQVLMMTAAMRVPAFLDIISLESADLPVAGTVHNTNYLLGRDAILGKTGSHDAAGGCFAFRAVRPGPDGEDLVITGVVLGQRDGPFIDAALTAARTMLGRIVREQASH